MMKKTKKTKRRDCEENFDVLGRGKVVAVSPRKAELQIMTGILAAEVECADPAG
jgi:hypothetical protein